MDEIQRNTNRVTNTSYTLPLRSPLIRTFQKVKEEPTDPSVATSFLGNPVYSSLTFKAIQANDANNLPTDVREIVSTDLTITEMLMTVSQTKNIVKTALNGRPGTVKEYISKGDYMITVEGYINSQYPNVMPKEEIKKLHTYEDLKQSIEIGSNFLSMFGITKVVVTEFSWYEIEGMRNQVSFRLSMLSDTDFKIEPTQNAVT